MSSKSISRRFTRIRRVLIGLTAAAAFAAPAWADDVHPGETNPIGDPNDFTLFPSQSVGFLGGQTHATYTDLVSYTAVSSNLDHWQIWAETLSSSDICTSTPQRRVTTGRVLTPAKDQAICATNTGFGIYKNIVGTKAEAVEYTYARPGALVRRSFDVRAGELVPDLDESGAVHGEVVAAYRDFHDRLSIDVVDYKARLMDSYASSSRWQVSGDVALALGDFNGDDTLDILVAADVSTGTGGPGHILLETISLDVASDGTATLNLKSNRVVQIQAPPRSLELAAADFAGQGYDQAVLGYYPDAADATQRRATLKVYGMGPDLEIHTASLTQALEGVHRDSYLAIAPGLFRLDPSNNYGLHRSQIALAYTNAQGKVQAQVLTVDSDLKSLIPGAVKQISLDSTPVATDQIGPGLGAGNLIGFKTDAVSPRKQLMISVPEMVDGQPHTTYPRIVVAEVDNTTQAINVTSRMNLDAYQMYGAAFAHPVFGYDGNGESFYLGNPAHIVVQDMIDPQYIIAMPPKHVDYLPVDPSRPDGDKEIINVSGYPLFYVQLMDKNENTLKETSTDTVSSTLGVGNTQSVEGTLTVGSMEIAGVQGSVKVETALNYETTNVQERENHYYTTRTLEETEQTNHDDQIVWNQRVVDIWRYPVYGLDLQRSDEFPFYELTLPRTPAEYRVPGRDAEWYNPTHSNNNALSYARIGQPGFPSDVGSFTYGSGNDPVRDILNTRTVRNFGGNAQTFDLNWSETAGGSQKKSFESNMSSSVDVTVGAKATGTIKKLGGSLEYSSTLSLSSKASWASSTLSEHEISNATGITLKQPSAGSAQGKSYDYETLIYVTTDGALKVAHATDVLRSPSGAGWWRNYYGGKPDPALNLPNRFTQTGRDIAPVWEITKDQDGYHYARGIAVTEDTTDPATGDYTYLAGGVTEGKRVRIETRVYNFSVDTTANDVVLAVAYQALDPNTFDPVGDPVEIGRTQAFDIGPRDSTTQAMVWDTSGRGGSGAGTPYRLVFTVDPDDTIANEVHELGATAGNNLGRWPWSSGFWVYNETETAQAAATARSAEAGNAGADPAAHVRVGLHAPESVALATTKRSGPVLQPSVDVEITSDRADARLRHVVIKAATTAGKGPQDVLAARTLYGVGPGTTRFRVPLPQHRLTKMAGDAKETTVHLQALVSGNRVNTEPERSRVPDRHPMASSPVVGVRVRVAE